MALSENTSLVLYQPNNSDVYLRCVKIDSRLRIRIVSHGYHLDANCQFPQNIRVENMYYKVPRLDVQFVSGPNRKYFYRIKKNNITVLDTPPTSIQQSVTKIFTDDNDNSCIVCYSERKEVVLSPCGHYNLCKKCATSLNPRVCPLCRTIISEIVNRSQIQV